MARRPYPTINGIAVPIFELDLPERHTRQENNHHNEWDRRTLGRSAILGLLRELGRHQYLLPVDIHESIHATYDPPEPPTERQAAREIICAYQRGEQFKKYDYNTAEYYFQPISHDLADMLVKEYGLYGPQPDRIGQLLEMEADATADTPYKKRKYHIQAFGDTLL